MNTELLNIQCQFLTKAIYLCENNDFMKTYDRSLPVSLENRRQVFKNWELQYNLNVFI